MVGNLGTKSARSVRRDLIPPPSARLTSVRHRILYATSVLLANRGYHGTLTRDIGKAVGMKGPSLYHHFDSKDAIVAELLDFSLGAPLPFIEDMAETKGDPAVRLYRYVRFDYMHMATSVYDLRGVHTEFIFNKRHFAEWRVKRDRMRQLTLGIVNEGIHLGRFVPVDPTVIRELIGSLVTQSMSDIRHPATAADSRAISEADLIIRAILANQDELERVRYEAVSFLEADEEFHSLHTSGHPSGQGQLNESQAAEVGEEGEKNSVIQLAESVPLPGEETNQERNGDEYCPREDVEQLRKQMSALQEAIERFLYRH